MQICEHHWEKLANAIKSRGLWGHVNQDGESARDEAVKELQNAGASDKGGFDPLLRCNWMICGTALKLGGLYLMNGDYCPICEAITHIKDASVEDVEKHWIDGPADSVLEYMQRLGLVPGAQ